VQGTGVGDGLADVLVGQYGSLIGFLGCGRAMLVRPNQQVSDCSGLFEPQFPSLLARYDLYLELESNLLSLHPTSLYASLSVARSRRNREGFVKARSRIDVPRQGNVFAADRWVSKVEVSTDGVRTWSEARLKTPLSDCTWRLWLYEWDSDAGITRSSCVPSTVPAGLEPATTDYESGIRGDPR
jgi:hypothetical protein